MLNVIPISALTGVMFVVVTHTFKWTSVVAVARALLPASALRAVGCGGGECRVPCCGQVRQLGRFGCCRFLTQLDRLCQQFLFRRLGLHALARDGAL